MTVHGKTSKFSVDHPTMSFTTLQGNENLKLLFILLAIDPSIGGLIIFGKTGTGKTLYLRSFKNFRIPLKKNTQCQYNCSISRGNLCSACIEKMKNNNQIETTVDYAPIVEMPSIASLDSIIGSLDINLNFRRGLFAQVNNGFLLVDDFHLVPKPTLDVVMNVFQSHQNVIHRHNISMNHPSHFCLIATVNTIHHSMSSVHSDKFGFSYFLEYDDTLKVRLDILNSNLKEINSSIDRTPFNKLQLEINKARDYLHNVTIPSEQLSFISQLCFKSHMQGYRPDITLAKGARALASFQGRTVVVKEDILLLAPFVLKHRLPEEEQDIINNILPEMSSHSISSLNARNLPNEKEFTKTPLIKDGISRIGEVLEKFTTITGIIVFSYLVALLVVNILSVPELFIYLFSGLTIWGLFTFFIHLWLRRRESLIYKDGFRKKNSTPNVRLFYKKKNTKATTAPIEKEINLDKDVIHDIDEGQSFRNKVLRVLRKKQQKGMITLSTRHPFLVTLVGILILLFSLVLFSLIIISLPIKTLINIFLFFLSLSTIAYVIQSLRKQSRIRNVINLGISSEKESYHINEKQIGSNISPIDEPSNMEKPVKLYASNLWNKLADLDFVNNKLKGNSGIQLLPSNPSINSNMTSTKVIADAFPHGSARVDMKERSKIGKRALSITTLQSGRVVGDQPFKRFPRNIHLLATIRNSVLRNYRSGVLNREKSLTIELEDIREKKFCSRVSATIIFVLDLSESIVKTINTVSASVNWLSRQAYLYRDHVGIVVLKGTQGVIIQPPTSNLNLVKRKLSDLRVSGSTPLAGGLQKAIELIKLDRIRSKNEAIPIIILITDGATNVPLLTDPLTGTARTVPLKKLGIDQAVKLAIQDCIALAQQIKKEKISLTIFSANLRGATLLKQVPRTNLETSTEFLRRLISEDHLFRSRRFIQLWSFALLRVLQEITGGSLYFLSTYQSDLNFETLRIARSEILSNIVN
ncbi:MAG: VWA domain-containing protein [Candidatus Hodarchaeota archaeon]